MIIAVTQRVVLRYYISKTSFYMIIINYNSYLISLLNPSTDQVVPKQFSPNNDALSKNLDPKELLKNNLSYAELSLEVLDFIEVSSNSIV